MAYIASQCGSPRLLGQMRERIRYKHYNFRTERAYVEWRSAVPTAPRKTSGPDPRHPAVLGATEGAKKQRQLRAETGLMLG